MLSDGEADLVKDAVYGIVLGRDWRPVEPFSVVRFKQIAVEKGYLDQTLADREGTTEVLEEALDELIAGEAGAGRATPIQRADAIAGRSRWSVLSDIEFLARRYIAAGGSHRYFGEPMRYDPAVDSSEAQKIWENEIAPLQGRERTLLYGYLGYIAHSARPSHFGAGGWPV